MISADAYLHFVDKALDGMLRTVVDLGDTIANERLELDQTNTPYAIVNHCIGVIEFWAGHKVAGRPSDRDRNAEFLASGSNADLVERVRVTREQLAVDVAAAQFDQPCVGQDRPDTSNIPEGCTQGGALVHVLEELTQHRGQLEVTADVLKVKGGQLA
ncbi:DinB family protein [Ornithinimicrobium sp. Arc0846-15]|nr:DinB family protein [Ornithinimicrobium laminariae]